LVLQCARLILWLGTKGSTFGWWLMDREDVIEAQRRLAQIVAEELRNGGGRS
jgi:hypothetical protein